MRYIAFILLLMGVLAARAGNVPTDSIADSVVTVEEAADTIEGKTLGEVEFVMQTVRHEANRDMFTVTKAMREGVSTSGEMLGRVQGLFYNYATQEVSYNGSKNIKILVDSIDKDEKYIKRLSPERFSRVDIIHNPKGEYQDYDVLVNLVTKRNYQGYEVSLTESVTVIPNENNGKGNELKEWNNWLQGTYTFNRWTYYLMGSWDRGYYGRSNYSSTDYPLNGIGESSVVGPKKVPETIERGTPLRLNAGADYRINDNHNVGVAVKYQHEPFRTTTDSRRAVTDFNEPKPVSVVTDYHTLLSRKPKYMYQLTAFYQGKSGLWKYDANVRFYDEKCTIFNTTRRGTGFELDDNRKWHNIWMVASGSVTRSTADGKWRFNLHVTQTWQNFSQRRFETGVELAKNINNTNVTEGWVEWNISPEWNLSANIGVHTVSLRTSAGNNTSVHPRFKLFAYHSFSPKAWVRASYLLQTFTPDALQILGYGQFTDSLLWVGGNPHLKTYTPHVFMLSAGLFNNLSIQASYTLNSNNVSPLYSAGEGERPDGLIGPYAVQSYANTRHDNWDVRVIYQRMIKKVFLYVGGGVNGALARYESLNKSATGGWGALAVQYAMPGGFNGVLQYTAFRDVQVTPQSLSTYDYDSLIIQLRRMFWKNRLDISLTYTAPLHILSGERRSTLTSPALVQTAWSNNQFRSDNALWLSVGLNLAGGQKVKKIERPDISL